MDRVQPTDRIKKRKAENQDNERLSKRLSLLNLERNGQKLYVPVEAPTIAESTSKAPTPNKSQEDDIMHLDDSKHKVYIYDLDAELSDSESSSDEGKLVFLPDIEKHLRETRIPPRILANSEGELAGNNLQLVLYNVPSSLTVPEEQDSVRRAIVETRARARARQEQRRLQDARGARTEPESSNGGLDARHWYQGMVNGQTFPPPDKKSMDKEPVIAPAVSQETLEYDPDAMDLG
ncbi:hypothetical protein N431DRAFT_560993 [Stipitochalara longipes BDJ]|nr:hypothetical protein N431DRAFT_560993 [Stipitochalara longipes BDJ]